MKSEFLLAFNQICNERGLPPNVVLDALRTALVSAYRRDVNISSAQNVTVKIDQQSGQAEIFVEKEAVEEVRNHHTEVALEVARQINNDVQSGDIVMVESTPKDFGRIAAQTAKQVILQRIREAEREALYEDYIEREGEIINGVVQSVTSHNISLNLGRTEAILPRKEQVPGERFTLHQRLRAYVVEVRRSGRGPQIIVSRSHKNMLRRLLELEVPEIYSGAVEIKAIAREAGARSKVAVAARQAGVDPVGSCVGMRGVRIQSIVNELGGEKIDVIEWDTDTPTFIAKSLSPARVLIVHLKESPNTGRTATVIVPDDQLSLAIGREGQNARLAAKLTGWRIDIKSITEAAREALAKTADEQLEAELSHLTNLLPTAAALLEYHAETRSSYNTEQLLLLRQIVDSVHNYYAVKRRVEPETLVDQKDIRRTAIADQEAQRRAERQESLARIPSQVYDIQLETLGLSTRVFNHLKKAPITNLGQIMERLVDGDEGLLALDGIGPKGLAEIKSQIETVSLAEPEEPAAEPAIETEPKVAPEAAAEAPVIQEEVVDEQAIPVAQVAVKPKVEAEAPVVLTEAEQTRRRAEREEALARIPTDAYDIPLQVLALNSQVQSHLKKAQIDNLGQLMEWLIGGDENLLALEGIDVKALAEIKAQVEIMVSIPSAEPMIAQEPAREPEKPTRPRYVYVADDEFEEKTKSKRRKKKQRQLIYDEEIKEVVSRRLRSDHDDKWEKLDE